MKLFFMRRKCYGCFVVVWKKRLIVVGGCDKNGIDVLDVEVFDLEGYVWFDLFFIFVGYFLCCVKIV